MADFRIQFMNKENREIIRAPRCIWRDGVVMFASEDGEDGEPIWLKMFNADVVESIETIGRPNGYER